ncbi:type II secretion system F family protein [Paraburkholderia rhizosphaerae]|uniref:Tight adherence protein C n=1 Tax=Paraburkholderia rhizosphaerae TaxID=480658 RepID=A0A4R8M404_9BURK|nr:type II secretion system F family protein [Paraburkholderia rhizosphaerae]TDY54562.1 tight adherence protein C [Paraburkholderia rhizosphaerae]
MLLISIIAGTGTTLAAYLLLRSLGHLGSDVPNEDRTWLDPLPPLLRLIWPLVNFVAHHAERYFSAALVQRTESLLRVTSLTFLMSAQQFIAMSWVCACAAAFGGSVITAATGLFQWWMPACFALFGYGYPHLWTRRVRQQHIAKIQRHLPIYLDFLTIAVEAGLNINGALQKAVEKGPDGALRRELEHVLRDLKSGLNRTEALRRFDERQRIKEVSNLVGAILQAERMGSGLARTLRFQSEQRRAERFQRAEKQAMEAPVKLVFPLLIFIFPVTFIVLGFPIVMKFVQEGLL